MPPGGPSAYLTGVSSREELKRCPRWRGVGEDTPDVTDADLYLRWLHDRDATAFETLARRHADLVVDVAWRVGGDRATAEDALQASLLALATDGTERPAGIGVRAWLARAALGRARNARASERSRGRRQAAGARDAGEGAMRGSRSAVEDPERSASVRQALDRLEGEHAAVLTLKYLHGVEYPELAAILDVAEPTARVRVHRALERLREEARRGDLDEGAMALGIAGAARTAVGAERLAEIVDAALADAAAGAVPAAAIAVGATAAGAAAGGTARGLLLALTACAAAVGGLALLWNRLAPTGDPPGQGRELGRASDAVPGPDAAPALAGHGTRSDVRKDAPSPDTPRTPDMPAAPPRPAKALSHDQPIPEEPEPQVETEIRLWLGDTDRRLRITSVSGGGLRGASDSPLPLHGLRLADGSVRVRVAPDSYLDVMTDDARTRFGWLVVKVSSDVGPTLDVRAPDPADPRFATPVLEFRDRKTGKPVFGVRMERTSWWGPIEPSVRADPEGRIRLEDSAGLSQAVFVAPGYVPTHGPLALSVVQREAWSAKGRLPIELDAIPGDVPSVSLRVVRADGTPLADGPVTILFPTWTSVPGLPLRPNADGVVRSPVPKVFGVVVFDGGFPVGTFLMARALWTEGATRELRLPSMARVRLQLSGLPADEPMHLTLTIETGTIVDRGHMADHRAESGRSADAMPDDFETIASAGPPASAIAGHEARLWAPVGSELVVRVSRAVDGEVQVRALRIRPMDGSPQDVVADWADLER